MVHFVGRANAWLSMALLIGGALTLTNASAAVADTVSTDQPVSTRLRFRDRLAKRYLRVRKHHVERTDGGNLRVRLVLYNESKRDAWVTVKCVFLDEEGFEVEATNNEEIEVPSRRDTTYSTTSLGTQASDYVIYFDNWSYSQGRQRD